MEALKLLQTRFFIQIEEGSDENIKESYEDIRIQIVTFAHSKAGWRVIHTGLTIFISEVSVIMESVSGKLLTYARRILEIAKGLLHQLELVITADGEHDGTAEPEKSMNDSGRKVVFTGRYADLCELIHLILAARFINGGNASARQYIMKGVHSLFGLEYDPKKYQNARDGIRRRCPAKGSRVTYFLDEKIDDVNAELAA